MVWFEPKRSPPRADDTERIQSSGAALVNSKWNNIRVVIVAEIIAPNFISGRVIVIVSFDALSTTSFAFLWHNNNQLVCISSCES